MPVDRWDHYRELRDRLGNLELLLAHENEEKSDKAFGEWISTRDQTFRQTQLIPEEDELLDLRRFDKFVEAREVLIRERLQGVLSGEQEG